MDTKERWQPLGALKKLCLLCSELIQLSLQGIQSYGGRPECALHIESSTGAGVRRILIRKGFGRGKGPKGTVHFGHARRQRPSLDVRRSFSARATSWRSEGGPQGCQYP